ncbi:hypothetical protein [Accumulibacter sp.]|uniref:hypothetical protein n=1 Tax=Accumulibacter sp. TaxID=2053492 RepID=UPI0028C4D9A5|nr:hypothetical protein [Accumulibacter sp.]
MLLTPARAVFFSSFCQKTRADHNGHGLFRFVRGHWRPAVTPKQIFDQHPIARAERVQRPERRQIDQRDLLQPDLDHTFLTGLAVMQQFLLLRRAARCGKKQAAFACAHATDQRHARPPLATKQLPRHGNGRYSWRHFSPAHLFQRATNAVKPATTLAFVESPGYCRCRGLSGTLCRQHG